MSDLFPLPLTPLERFFFLDDFPSYPNHIICRLRFVGRLDRERFAQAFQAWGPRHDMSVAQVHPSRRRMVWTVKQGDLPDLMWTTAEEGQLGFPPLPPLNLRGGFATRVVVVERSTETDIILQTHHAALDGIGGMQAIQDLLVLYAAQFPNDRGKRRTVHRVDRQRLAQRNQHFSSLWQAIRQLPQQAIGLYGAIKYWSRRAIPLVEPHRDAPENPSTHTPRAVTHLFTQAESDQLRKVAQASKATVNDVLIRDVLLTMRSWQNQRGIERGRRVFRIMIPINLRTIADRRLGAANRVSMVYLDRTDKQLERPRELLWGINFEMQTILRLNLGLTCLAMIRVMSWIPGMMRRQVTARKCRSTCILTNLGEPFARSRFPRDEQGRAIVGNVTLESFDLLAPLRPLTAAAFSIFKYCGRTGITLHYDAFSLTEEEADTLLAQYVKKLQHSIRRAEKRPKRPGEPTESPPR